MKKQLFPTGRSIAAWLIQLVLVVTVVVLVVALVLWLTPTPRTYRLADRVDAHTGVSHNSGHQQRALRSAHVVNQNSVPTTPTTSTSITTSTLPALSASGGSVLVAGDSISFDVGAGLTGQLAGTGLRVINRGKPSSGLSVPAFYDWPAHLAQFMASDKPDVLVVLLGANDAQGLYVGGHAAAFATPAWCVEYQKRVASVLNVARAVHVPVLWLGPPQMRDPLYDSRVAFIGTLIAKVIAADPNAMWVSTRNALTTAPGHFELSAPVNGVLEQIRTADGIHPTRVGQNLLATFTIDVLRSKFGFAGRSVAPFYLGSPGP